MNNKNLMNIPWVESPLFNKILNSINITEEQKNLALKFNKDGYVVIDLNLDDSLIESLKNDINQNSNKHQENFYHYSDSPRVFEAWKHSEHVRTIANHPKVIETIEFLYGRRTFPFQTINFIKGSNQPIHSDAIHFHTIPYNWVAASWVALEDVDETNGTLVYCPTSHKLSIFDFKSLNLQPAKYSEQAENYKQYEQFIEDVIESNNFEKKPFIAKKGQAIIWSANLLHGGLKVVDPTRTRWSQATNYYFEGCEHYYAPMFSDPFNNTYAEKDIKNKNIRDYKS
jgi:ectoine hydroxylase-related dioxygenase (phytanoyl-CoA dioxygenase family)